MLDSAIKEQLRGLFADLSSSYSLDISIDPQSENRSEAVELIGDLAECSEKISYSVVDGDALIITLSKDGEATGISFRAIPNGHEFTSLLLAILNSDGKGKNLPDEFTARRIAALKGEIAITTYMSLTCTNCPDIVQSLNIMATLGSGITHEAVDGAINQEEVERLNIQSVPTVYANGELLHVGRGSMGDLLDKLEAKFGSAEIAAVEAKEYDVVVAGGGPSGVSAAIYSARKGLSVAIVCGKVGGQVNETVGIENLISTPETTGAKLAQNLKAHMQEYPIDIYENRFITSVESFDDHRLITAKGGESFKTRALIVATGASWRKLGVEGEENYLGKGVAFCPHCDGPFYKGREVAVVGGGNSGVEAAIDLAGICSKVTVLEFMEELKADTVLQDRLRSLPNVEIFTNVETKRISGDGAKVESVTIRNRSTGEEKRVDLSGIFIQIGLTANSSIVKDLVETNRIGEIIIDKNGRTSEKGIYAAGDVTDVSYKQIIIAMGEGAKTALAAFDDRIRSQI